MVSAEAAAGSQTFPDGRVDWNRPYFNWPVLIRIVTTLLCLALIWSLHLDVHLEPNHLEPGVSITSSGFLSIYTQSLNDDTLEVVSGSSGSVDVMVKTEDGRVLSVYSGLMPGESCSFEYDGEPCTVVASAS